MTEDNLPGIAPTEFVVAMTSWKLLKVIPLDRAWSKLSAGCIQFLSEIPTKDTVFESSILNVNANVSSCGLYLALSLSVTFESTMVGEASVNLILVGNGTAFTLQLLLNKHCNLDIIWVSLSVILIRNILKQESL